MKIYVLGVAGAGVSALASILQSEGHEVTGSDDGVYPPVSTYLDRIGVRYRIGFDAGALPADIDLAIIGTTAKLGADNPERVELARRGVPAFTFAEHLGALTAARETLVVAGSFGKSTLTAMIAYFLRTAGRDPGYFIGAVPLDLERTGWAGADPQFIVEGDEYVVSLADRRPKFALYHPSHALISSIVHDHVNMFPTPEIYQDLFRILIDRTPAEGLLICADGYPALRALTQGRRAVWYGLGPEADYRAEAIEIGEETRFTLLTPRHGAIPLATGLLGLHNIENIAGACAYVLERGLAEPADLQRAARSFRGVARRLDKKTGPSRIPAYEGFGSSYEKARSAIEAMELHFAGRPLIVVFEPHAFSWRNEDALAWYDDVFQGAAQVALLPPPQHGATGHKQLTQAEIAARITAAGVGVMSFAGAHDLLSWAETGLSGHEVVLLLSSGPLAGLAESLPALLDRRFG